ncbi:hypothetical protein FB446DRAFT_794500 [Lentinula raphanica]|nr:hypothetical protein FB446DRAFT_794500 [Lentinula raphanica]
MRLTSLSLCSLSVVLLSFHSLFVLAVPLNVNDPDTRTVARRGDLPPTRLWVERLKAKQRNVPLHWRFRLSKKYQLVPIQHSDKEWGFTTSSPANPPNLANPVDLGTLKNIDDGQIKLLKDRFEGLRVADPQSLMNAALDVIVPGLSSLTESSSPLQSQPLPGVTFTQASDDANIWGIYRDSKNLYPNEFWTRYGCDPTNWMLLFEVQRVSFDSHIIKLYLEQLVRKLPDHPLHWRLRLGDVQHFHPILLDDQKWRFKPAEKAPTIRMTNAVHLGTFRNVRDGQREALQNMFLDLEADYPEYLLDTVMQTASPDFAFSPRSGFSLPQVPGVTFFRASGTPDAWAIHHDSRYLQPAAFEEKYGGDSFNWMEVLEGQRKEAEAAKKRQRSEGETAE